MKVLVTGTAGFIGSHVAQVLLARGDTVIGFDSLNDYYDVTLKQARLARFIDHPNYIHVQADLADRAAVEQVFAHHRPERVINLAAQAGVRYAAENPHVYVASNVTGFLHILEGCRHHGVQHLVYASTSSVYGANTNMPFSEHASAEHPLTLYAATKKANEQMAHSYAHLYAIPTTGLRFFTVYGPWGRPDMALFLFTRAILDGKPIRVFNHGKHKRSSSTGCSLPMLYRRYGATPLVAGSGAALFHTGSTNAGSRPAPISRSTALTSSASANNSSIQPLIRKKRR